MSFPPLPESLRVQCAYLTTHIVPGPLSYLYFFPLIFPFLCLLVPPTLSHRQLRNVSLPIIYGVQLYVWYRDRSFDVISMNQVLVTFELIGWYDVRKDFKRVHRRRDVKGGSQNILEPYPQSFTKRIVWLGMLCASLRLTDFHIGMKSHDRRQPSSIHPFRSFFLNTLAHCVLSYVLLFFTNRVVSSQSFNEQSVPIFHSIIFLAHIYSALSLFTAYIPTLIALLGTSWSSTIQSDARISPLTWPSHFGQFSSIWDIHRKNWGLRAFWGEFWHQNMRHMTSTPGIAVSDTLGLESGSTTRYMIIMTSAFFFSGVVHAGLVPPEPFTNMSNWQLRLLLASFFWLQVVGVGMEVLVQNLVGGLAGRKGSKSPDGQDNKVNNNSNAKKSKPSPTMSTRWTCTAFGLKLFIFIWTLAYLATTAWWTIRIAGNELNWWNMRGLSKYFDLWREFNHRHVG